MSDKPILFSAPMVRAILDGRKTQTRRVMKAKPTSLDYIQAEWEAMQVNDLQTAYTPKREHLMPPFCGVGDRLWAREAFRAHAEYNELKPSELPRDANLQFLADDPPSPWDSRYRNARFMPRWASRLTLIVTNVRVQRLQDISEADAVAEGCRGYVSRDGEDGESPGEEFEALWNSIHGPGAWGANPWVAAVTFDVHQYNIDQMQLR